MFYVETGTGSPATELTIEHKNKKQYMWNIRRLTFYYVITEIIAMYYCKKKQKGRNSIHEHARFEL